ncbi:hypothetical protein LY76DRAFT_328009 [Colletotrichum caudatum]|nr:hypothetical protein LY76DRAFT_328009 [Colletotrichum caudatum]
MSIAIIEHRLLVSTEFQLWRIFILPGLRLLTTGQSATPHVDMRNVRHGHQRWRPMRWLVGSFIYLEAPSNCQSHAPILPDGRRCAAERPFCVLRSLEHQLCPVVRLLTQRLAAQLCMPLPRSRIHAGPPHWPGRLEPSAIACTYVTSHC